MAYDIREHFNGALLRERVFDSIVAATVDTAATRAGALTNLFWVRLGAVVRQTTRHRAIGSGFFIHSAR